MTYNKLEKEFEKYITLRNIKLLLHWDTNVNLPKNSLPYREKQVSYINKEINDFLRSEHLQLLLKKSDKKNLNKWQQRNLKLIHKIKEENEIYPKKLLESISTHSMRCESLWRKAKATNQFTIVKDALKSLFLLIKEKANRRGDWLQKNNYDALLDIHSSGLTSNTIDKIFNELKETLPSIISRLSKKNSNLHNPIKLKEPHEFNIIAKKLATEMGFNFNNGRIDTSTHPFCGGYPQDTRITHHYNGNNFTNALYAIIHEAGHGLYEQNLPKKWDYQPVGKACDYAAHEGSSLLHEFFIGRNKYFLAKINKIIRPYIHNYKKESLINEIKKIQSNNPIRILADMVTYPLHIILRYELEKLLFNDSLKIEDLPEYWNQQHEKLFGFKITSDTDGCLQDIHWYMGAFGYFPSYCMGLIYAAQMYHLLGFNLVQDTKSFKQTFNNLKKNFYEYGSLYEFEELVQKCTGKKLDVSYYYKFIDSEIPLSYDF